MEPVAQALLPAASPPLGTLLIRRRLSRVETSLDTAGGAPWASACATGWLLFGYLLATGSYKFRVLDGCIGARGLAALSLLGARWRDCRQERGRHVGQSRQRAPRRERA